MTGLRLGLGMRSGACHDARGMALTGGAEIARRRKQLIWNQAMLAKKAGVGLTTVVQIENDRDVRLANLRAVESALVKDEQGRGLRPNLTTPPDTTEPSPTNGGADVRKVAGERLNRVENLLALALEDVRRMRADLDAARADERKSG
jgi:DNA-binding XRE family transcriptional regulator